jgi:hypothetical protein
MSSDLEVVLSFAHRQWSAANGSGKVLCDSPLK